jgi:hypothetical protein
VAKEALSAELNDLILTKDSTAHPGTKEYLIHVQDCLTELLKGLTKKQFEEFAALATLRNTVGVESDLKAKWVQPFILFCQNSDSLHEGKLTNILSMLPRSSLKMFINKWV